jgi:C1A family cysteine protease
MPKGKRPPIKVEAKTVETPVVRKKIAGKVRMLYGWKPDRPDHRDQVMKVPSGKLKLPLKVDLAAKMTRVENQGDIGSCVANSSTTAAEYLYKLAGKRQPELSRLYVYYWCRFLDGVPPEEDSGTYIRTSMKCLASYGASLEDLWKYDVTKYHMKPPQAAVADGQNRQIMRYYRTPTLAHIKLCLAEGYPSVFGFSVPESMFSGDTGSTGIVLYPGKRESIVGGHAVLAVGYDEKTQMLKFQNSWGTGWGKGGFGFLPYRYVTDGLASDFWTVRTSEMG